VEVPGGEVGGGVMIEVEDDVEHEEVEVEVVVVTGGGEEKDVAQGMCNV